MSTPRKAPRKWHVTLIEWSSHRAVIEADSSDEAEEIALRLWEESGEQVFRLRDSGIDGVSVGDV